MFKINLSKISTPDIKKYTKFIFVFIIILFLIGAYFLWLPVYQDFMKNRVNLDVEAEKVKKKKDYILELENNLSNLGDYKEEISKINSALPLQYSASSLFSFVQKTASESGMIVITADMLTSYSKKTQTANGAGAIEIDTIDISVTIRGKYSSFKDFVSSVYKSSRLIEIVTINIEPAKSKEQGVEQIPGVFDFNLGMYAHYYNQ